MNAPDFENVRSVVLVVERHRGLVAQLQHFLQDRDVLVHAAAVEGVLDGLARLRDGARVENREHRRVRQRDLELAVVALLEPRNEFGAQTLEFLFRKEELDRFLVQVLVELDAKLGQFLLPLLDVLLFDGVQLETVALEILHQPVHIAHLGLVNRLCKNMTQQQQK